MKKSCTIFCIFTLVATIAPSWVISQTISPFETTSEPFKIRPGTSFAATGGSTTLSAAAASVSKIAKTSSDLSEAEELIRRSYIGGSSTNLADLTKAALTGALRSLDPHSNYFDASEWKNLLEEEQSGYSGIGVSLGEFTRNDVTETYILSTFEASAAARSNLRFGDRIVAVNGEQMAGKSSSEIREKLRGDAGTTVRLTVERVSTLTIETLELRRNRVPQPSIPDSYILRPGIGYIDLSQGFNYTTSSEMDAALKSLHYQGMHSLILDLRGNPGGIVDQAVKIAEKFLPAGTLIVTQRGRARNDNREWRSANPSPETMPLVLLVDAHTASASEIVAGALQDCDRALIVGTRTFGKGLVQSVIDLPNGTGLTLTAARYLTPSGRSIQRDYYETGLYDYYNHSSPVAAIDQPFFEAKTITGRKVFGGDGIAPDEIVKSIELTGTQTQLLDPIFFFTRDQTAGRMGNARTNFTQLYAGDSLSPILTASVTTAVAGYSNSTPSDLGSHATKSFIQRQLLFYSTLAAKGSLSAIRVLTENDPQIDCALNQLVRAALLSSSVRQTLAEKNLSGR